MGWNDKVFPLLIVTSGGGFTGAFFYSPSVGPGNLIYSIAGSAGTDPFGNAYQAGATSYGKLGPVVQEMVSTGGTLAWAAASSEAGPYSATASISPNATTELQFLIGSKSFLLLGPSGDTSGATDYANLSNALVNGMSVLALPGTFYLNNQPVVGTQLDGCGMATVFRSNTTGPAYTGPLLDVGAKGSIRNLTVSNSGSDAITVAGGIAEWWLEDLNFASNAGWCINATITGPVHGRIRGIRGQGGAAANGGGIFLNGGTSGAVTAEVNVTDVDIQNCQSTEVLHLLSVTDVLCSVLNGSVKSGAGFPAIHVEGSCQTCWLKGFDAGGGAGVLVIEQGTGSSSPSEIDIEGSVFQSSASGAGVTVHDGSARIRFRGVMSKRSQGDGWLWDGTGGFNQMSHCAGNLNNQAAGTAYDVNVTSTAHILNTGFAYVSGGVTFGRNLTSATNHYTERDPSSSITTTGNAPGGW